MNEIEALQQELEQTKLAYQMAAQLSEFKTGFLVRTAHELRSPLSSLIGLHQLILSDLCDNAAEEREFIAESYKAAQKLMKMIDEIVNVSKIEYGRISLTIEPIKITRVFQKLHKLTNLQAINRGLKLKFETPETEIYIKADYQRFVHSLVTLVDAGISLLERGTILVSSGGKSSQNLAEITIDLPCSTVRWKKEKPILDLDELTLESLKQFSHQVEMSPGMKLMICQTLLEKMGGQLDMIELTSEHSPEPFTRLLMLIPFAGKSDLVQSQIRS
ncbi:MAG TPA: sensor histidine kinase [Cyanothece sp. UBA12306]|nr:sensor histidine kinase [Cyanothece sp. UBA12306]